MTACLIVLLTVLTCASCNHITVTSLIVGDSLPNGQNAIAAAHDVAMGRIESRYPNLFRHIQYHREYYDGNLTCEEAASEMPWFGGRALHRSKEHPAKEKRAAGFILAPGCSLEIRSLGDIARESDFVLLASTAVHQWFSNRTRYPTVIAMGPSNYGTVSKAIVAMLVEYKWKRVSVICNNYDEDDKDDPTYNMALEVLCHMIRSDLPKNIAGSLYDTKSSSQSDLRRTMLNAAGYSSVFVIVTAAKLTSQLLDIAGELGMGNGKAVFFIPGLAERPDEESDLFVGIQTSNVTNIRRILPFTFKVYPKVPDGNGICEALQDIRNVAEHKYGVRTDDFETQMLQISAYESVMIMAEVLDANYDMIMNVTTAELTALFLNRSFHVDGEVIGLSSTGLRGGAVYVNSYFAKDTNFKLVFIYTAETGLLPHINNTVEWGGKPLPSQNAGPLCQFTTSGCWKEDMNSSYFTLLLAPAVVIGFLVFVRTTRFCTSVDSSRSWWLGDELVKRNLGPKSQRGRRMSALTIDESISTEEAAYRGTHVEYDRLPMAIKFNDISRNQKSVHVLKTIMHLEHANISKFIGIGNHPTVGNIHQLVIAFEYPAKGTLRQVIDNDDMALSWDLRLSLIWDLIDGIRFLHSTPMRLHCFVNSVKSLVLDRHFTLKITRIGMLQFYTSLTSADKCHLTVPAVFAFWMAPECLIGISTKASYLKYDEKGSALCELDTTLVDKIASPASDIYSLGVVLYEIVTRNTPYSVNLMDNTDVLTKTNGLASLSVELNTASDEIPEVIANICRQCYAQRVQERPTLEQISHSLRNVYTYNKLSFTESLMNRLQNYHRELETIVGARTEALRQEMKKTDDLLCNLLPSSVAKMLRERSHVPPEFFESVTVMFSEVPAFNDIVSNCSPFDVVTFLHQLYSALDTEIPKFDVYKVETIKDSYMLASGLPNRFDRHATEIAEVSLCFMEAASGIFNPCNNGETIKLKIGINSGPVVATVIGSKLPHYCLVGDTVNFASRMETHGVENRIHVSTSSKNLLDPNQFIFKERGLVEIKGRGDHFTFWLLGRHLDSSVIRTVAFDSTG